MTTASPTTERRDPRLTAALVAVAVCGALLCVGSVFTHGPKVAGSVAAGAAIAASNLYVLSRIVRALIGGDQAGEGRGAGMGAGAWGVLALGKMLVLFGGIWLLMTSGRVDPIGLLVGYGSLPIGIAFGSIVSDRLG
jgi:hypothetical protein